MSNINDERLQNYLDAEKKALNSQEYKDGTKTVRRADLSSISNGLSGLIAAANLKDGSTVVTAKQVIPRDI